MMLPGFLESQSPRMRLVFGCAALVPRGSAPDCRRTWQRFECWERNLCPAGVLLDGYLCVLWQGVSHG